VPRNNVRLGDGRGHRLAAMSVTLNMPDELVERLQAAATARGISAEELAIELLVEAATPKRRHLAFAGIGASRHGISHRIEELLADGFGRD
jgi:plasmid stability protein